MQLAFKKANILKQIYENIIKSKGKFVNDQNKMRKIVFQLKEEKNIYLLRKNLKTRKKSKKLDFIKVRKFLIKGKKEIISY